MAGRWYYRQDGAEFGPVALPQLTQLASTGQIHLTDWVREGETSAWCPVAQSPAVMAAVSATRAPSAPPVRSPAPKAASPKPAPPKPLPRAAALPPAPRPPAPQPPPHATAVKALPPRSVAPAPMPVAAPVSKAHVSQPVVRRPKKSSVGITIGLAIAGVGAAIVLIAILVMASGGSDAEVTAGKGSEKRAAGEAVAADETSSADRLSPVQVNMTKGIRNWRDVAKKGALKGLIGFEVKNVAWATGSTSGGIDMAKAEAMAQEMAARVRDELAKNPDLKPQAESADAIRELADKFPSGAAGQGARSVLRIEVAITNTGEEPLSYASWNSRGKSGAWLVDGDLKLVAFPSGDGKTTSLAPKQTVIETLEFATSSTDFSELRLVLPYAAVQRSGQWGYLLDGATLRGEKAPKTAPQVAKAAQESAVPAAEAAPAPPATTLIINEDEPAAPVIIASDAPMAEVVDDGEPKEDIRDLVRQSKEKEKMDAPQNE